MFKDRVTKICSIHANMLRVNFPLLKVQSCISSPLNNSFLSWTSFFPWTLLPFYHKFYLGIKLTVQPKCGCVSSLSQLQTNPGRNVSKPNPVKPKPKESNILWKIIINKTIWFLLLILQKTPESDWLYIASLSDMVGVLSEMKLNMQSLIKSDFTILIQVFCYS